MRLCVGMLAGEVDIDILPTPHDFRYVYVDKVPHSHDKQVVNVDAAIRLINSIKSKL